MSKCYKKFGQNDVFYNQIKAHPESEFFIYNSAVYYNKRPRIQGAFTASVPAGIHAPPAPGATGRAGNISLYELNVDRDHDPSTPTSIYPIITKSTSLMSFKTISTTNFNRDFLYGEDVTGSYPLSSSIERRLFSHTPSFRASDGKSNNDFQSSSTGSALKNTINNYKVFSPLFDFDRFSTENDDTGEAVNLISIPSIFFGSSIRRGSVDLRYFITGTLVGRLMDEKRNGELVQIGPTGSAGSGNIAGLVLYNEGFVILTGSWDLSPTSTGHTKIDYNNDATPVTSSWLYYAVGANDSIPRDIENDPGTGFRNSASYSLAFEGTTYTPVVTMMAHTEKGEQNHSNNPTYVVSRQTASLTPYSSSYLYKEKDFDIKNTISSSYEDPEAPFEKQTFISKIGIYDEQQNLIAVASLSNPVKKKEDQNYTFKLKLDI
jgi:hypothetical protein